MIHREREKVAARAAALTPTWARDRRTLALALALAGCGALLVAHASTYLPFFADDGFISLRYADRLLHGHGLTWSDGERVEGYSNLAWILGCALLGAVRVNLILAARLLGAGSALAALAALARGVRPDLPPLRAALVFTAGGLVLASSGPFAVWAIGGLEQPLVAALLLWGVVETGRLLESGRSGWRCLLPAGVPLGVLAWTRPDGALFGVVIAVALAALQVQGSPHRGRARFRSAVDAARLAVFPLAFAAAQLAFRLAYYGEWLPNPALVKLAFTSERMREGWAYLASSLSVHVNPLLLASAALLPLVQDRQARRRIALAAAPLAAWLLYVVAIGGDIFPARRHFVPVLALLALLVIEAMGWAARRSLPWRASAAAASLVVVVFGALRQSGDPELHRADTERWEWDGRPVGTLLRRHFLDRRALLAADSAGTLPYFSALPAIDLLGLNDKTMSHHRPPGYGHGPLGHEIGDGAYALSRAPDLVVFGLPTGEDHALYKSGIEMQRDPSFLRDYALVNFEADGDSTVRTRIWVRRLGRIGMERSDSLVQIPGFLLASAPGVFAREDGDGKLGTMVTPYGSGRAEFGPLAAGEWGAHAEFTGPAPRIVVRTGEEELASGPPGVTFRVYGRATRGVILYVESVGAALTHVRSLRLERVDRAGGG